MYIFVFRPKFPNVVEQRGRHTKQSYLDGTKYEKFSFVFFFHIQTNPFGLKVDPVLFSKMLVR